MLFVVVLSVLVREGFGAGDTSCLNKISVCYQYMNRNGDVPDTCCGPLKSVVEHDKSCFCNLISKKESDRAEKAGINITAAQQLPARCGLRVNPISCLTSSGSPSPGSSNQDSAAALLLPSANVIVVIAMCIVFPIFMLSSPFV
ncbi:hypothetical protein ACFE04_018152 [Oxalis oulophora]